MSLMKPAIRIENLSFSYEDNGRETLKNISFDIKQGEFLSIIGHSGCGKSTLIRLMSGLEHSYKGKIVIEGNQVHRPPRSLSVIFQENSLFPWMTARKNIEFAVKQVKRLSPKQVTELSEKMLEKVGLSMDGNKYPFQLSGGMKQRVAIARALSMDADIILMDEPFSALDIGMKRELEELLIKLWQERNGKLTVVMVTHDINEAVLLSDRILFMEKGEIHQEFLVPFVRPRSRSSFEYKELRQSLAHIFNVQEEV